MERIFRLGCPQCKRIFPVDYAIRFLAIQFECPYCRRHKVVNLDDLLCSPRSDFFRCCVCFSWWMVPKGTTEPVTRIVLRNHSSSVN